MLKKHKDYSFGEIALFSAIIVLVSFTLWYVFNANSNANKIYDSISTTSAGKNNKITIESDPSEVSIKSSNYCDSSKLKKLTPFSCSIPAGIDSVTLTAPVTASKEGKKYNFKEWTGCSNIHTDRYTCNVVLPAKDPVKATYTTGATSNSAAPPPAAVAAPQAKCNGTLVNGGKNCRYVITYDQSRLPGRLTAFAIQTSPSTQLWSEIPFSAECSNHDACVNGATNAQTTGVVNGPRVEFNISKATTINIDVPMSQEKGSAGAYYLLNQWVYDKATYANGGGGTYYDGLRAEYTLQYRL